MFFLEDSYHNNGQRPFQGRQGQLPSLRGGEDTEGGRLSLSFILNDQQQKQQQQQQRMNLTSLSSMPSHPASLNTSFRSIPSSSSYLDRSTELPPMYPFASNYLPAPLHPDSRPQNLSPFNPTASNNRNTTSPDSRPIYSSRLPIPSTLSTSATYSTIPAAARNEATQQANKMKLQGKAIKKKSTASKNSSLPALAETEKTDFLVQQLRALKERAVISTTTTTTTTTTAPSSSSLPSPSGSPLDGRSRSASPELIQPNAKSINEGNGSFTVSSSSASQEVATCRRNKQVVQDLLDAPLPFTDPYPADAKMKQRERATPEQVAFLEKIFSLDPLPSAATRARLADKLSMTPKRVQIWFQNKRARVKVDQKITEKCSNFKPNTQPGSSSWSSFFEVEERTKGSKRKTAGKASFTFHNLARCDDGQLILRSEGGPSLILQPSLHKEKI